MATTSRDEPHMPDEETGESSRRHAGPRLPRGPNELIRSHLPFVIALARRYRWTRLSMDDLISAGNLGLMRAARRFDRARGVRFTTYAAFWIRRSILQTAARDSRVVSVPTYQLQKRLEIALAEVTLRRTLRRRPSPSELAEQLAVPRRNVEQVLCRGGLEISLDDPVDGTPGAILRTRLADERELTAEQVLERQELLSMLRELVDQLSDRSRAVVTLRYGLDNTPPRTLAEIGRRLDVSRERVRQIEVDALRRLRSSFDRSY